MAVPKEIEIDGSHDYYRFSIDSLDPPFGRPSIDRLDIELWSRGSFTVMLNLSSGDTRTLGEALLAWADELDKRNQ